MTEIAAAHAGGATQTVPYFPGHSRIGWRERPVPAPGPGELLLRVRANALCGTDRDLLAHGSDVTPGHEAAGEVESVGPGTSTAIGSRGVVYLMDYCATCRFCAVGATNQCLAKRADMGFTHDGGLGRYQLVRESQFFDVGTDLDLATATLLLDVMGTTSHAIDRARLLRPDIDSVLVAGAGPVGLGVVAMARLLLAEGIRIFVTDMVPYRLALAAGLGARPLDPSGSVPEPIDVAIDTTGREAARRQLLDALGRRGVLVCVGHGEGLAVSVSADLIAPERAVLGSEYFPYDSLHANLRLLERHGPMLESIITHRFPVEELVAAWSVFESGDSGKVVVIQ